MKEKKEVRLKRNNNSHVCVGVQRGGGQRQTDIDLYIKKSPKPVSKFRKVTKSAYRNQ